MCDEKKRKVRLVLLASVIFSLFFGSAVFGSGNQYSLLVQKSPVYGGIVSPEGIIDSVAGQNFVQIKALPSNGYEFAYWLGDVTEPTSRTTTVHVDTPKMVIAVFERVELDRPAKSGNGRGMGGGGGLTQSPSKIHSPGGVSPASPSSRPRRYSTTTTSDDFEVEVDIPIPEVPEPATLLLLGSGIFYVCRKRHQKI